MKDLTPNHHHRRKQGVALVLVLCFIVLITGLVVAYFSRTLTTLQLSNASTSSVEAKILANSATDTILGDLKQEIADGSIMATPPPTSSPAGNPVYVPKQAAYAVPQRNPTAANTGQSADPLPNLVRRSLQADTGSIPAPALTSHASAASSSTPSANGHFVSTARWNRHYLLPTAPPAGASSSSLNASTPVAAFTPPDWVFVTAEKGPDVLSSPTTDGAGKVTVTGRYAYAIYDEGGLLDANHTGYPSTSTPSHIGGKPVPSYADLTQIPMAAAAQTFLTTANVDNLLGWRNYATLQSTSSFPNLQPSTSSEAAYYGLFTANVANPTVTTPGLAQVPPTTWNNATDQMFLSRQQLIDYFTAAKLDPGYLQYLGTFSRSLNQPSYVQEHSAVALDPPIRPAVLSSSAGGNDAGDDSTNPSTNITPKFPLTRVINTFTRFDGTTAIPGEPLIKKRFPLDRLAWLTYKGA